MIKRDIPHYMQLFRMHVDEITLIKNAGAVLDLAKEMDPITFEFIDFLKNSHTEYNFTADVINGVDAIKSVLWEDLVVNPLNEKFIENHKQFGAVFSSLGVPYEGYLAAIAAYYNIVVQFYKKHNIPDNGLLYAYKKLESVHTIIVEEVYRDTTQKALMEQNSALKEMSTPVTQLWDGILLLPLVGFLDSQRAQETMNAMLNMIGNTQAKVFILDISGVAVVDTAVANYLIKMTKASRLMGCTCMISGISGSVAQTIVELGIQIEEVETTGNMKEALNRALKTTGAKVIYQENE